MGGLPLTLTVPLGSYSGIAAKVSVNEMSGDLDYQVILLHRDHALSIPLYASTDMELTADHWEAWSNALVLPLLTLDGDGTCKLARLGLNTCSKGDALPRRKLRALTGRRPRFLVMRQTGKPTPLQRFFCQFPSFHVPAASGYLKEVSDKAVEHQSNKQDHTEGGVGLEQFKALITVINIQSTDLVE